MMQEKWPEEPEKNLLLPPPGGIAMPLTGLCFTDDFLFLF